MKCQIVWAMSYVTPVLSLSVPNQMVPSQKPGRQSLLAWYAECLVKSWYREVLTKWNEWNWMGLVIPKSGWSTEFPEELKHFSPWTSGCRNSGRPWKLYFWTHPGESPIEPGLVAFGSDHRSLKNAWERKVGEGWGSFVPENPAHPLRSSSSAISSVNSPSGCWSLYLLSL